MAVGAGVEVAVGVGVLVAVGAGVLVVPGGGVFVAFGVGVRVGVGVLVAVGVGVLVGVGVFVAPGGGVGVRVGVGVLVGVGVELGETTSQLTQEQPLAALSQTFDPFSNTRISVCHTPQSSAVPSQLFDSFGCKVTVSVVGSPPQNGFDSHSVFESFSTKQTKCLTVRLTAVFLLLVTVTPNLPAEH